MKKAFWILLGIGGVAGTLFCGYKWLETTVQKNSVAREKEDWRLKHNNEVVENNYLRQRNTVISQENTELKDKISKLPPQSNNG